MSFSFAGEQLLLTEFFGKRSRNSKCPARTSSAKRKVQSHGDAIEPSRKKGKYTESDVLPCPAGSSSKSASGGSTTETRQHKTRSGTANVLVPSRSTNKRHEVCISEYCDPLPKLICPHIHRIRLFFRLTRMSFRPVQTSRSRCHSFLSILTE